jgi:hypothetical protein
VVLASLSLVLGALVQADCKDSPSIVPPPPPIAVAIPSEFEPVPLPDPHVEGFVFPEASATILGWAANGDETAMARHAWGLWTALTLDSGQSFEGQPLRVFDTWFTIDDLNDDAIVGRRARRTPHPLDELARLAEARRAKKAVDGSVAVVGAGESEILGTVKFSPDAAMHIGQYDLLSAARLVSLRTSSGLTDVPAFPAKSVVAKAVYRLLSIGPDGKGAYPRYQSIPYWTGPPDPPAPSASTTWTSCVWVDTLDQGQGTGTGEVDSVCASDGSSRTAGSTYGLGRFVYFMITPGGLVPGVTLARAEATRPQVGDAVIMVALHVTTRETTGWTWETFWWTPDADHPPLPSSNVFATERPKELLGPARSFAGCAVLSMQMPPEPLTGGSGKGESVYCYNPWLEGHFGPADLVDSVPGTYEGKVVQNDVGAQSNCMSCHAQASFSTLGGSTPGYTGDRYVDIQGSEFAGTIRTEFLWSVADAAH